MWHHFIKTEAVPILSYRTEQWTWIWVGQTLLISFWWSNKIPLYAEWHSFFLLSVFFQFLVTFSLFLFLVGQKGPMTPRATCKSVNHVWYSWTWIDGGDFRWLNQTLSYGMAIVDWWVGVMRCSTECPLYFNDWLILLICWWPKPNRFCEILFCIRARCGSTQQHTYFVLSLILFCWPALLIS